MVDSVGLGKLKLENRGIFSGPFSRLFSKHQNLNGTFADATLSLLNLFIVVSYTFSVYIFLA